MQSEIKYYAVGGITIAILTLVLNEYYPLLHDKLGPHFHTQQHYFQFNQISLSGFESTLSARNIF